MQCNQAQNLTSLAEAWFPALWFLPLRVFTICLPVITTTISCFEFYYRKRFPVCFFKIERDFNLKLRWMENFHEIRGKKHLPVFSSCLFTKLGVIGFCLKCPGQQFFFCPWSIFCCCCLIHPVPKGTNAWKCLHFSLVSWKSWPIDKKNTSATIIWHLQSFWSYWLFELIFLNPSHMFILYSVTYYLTEVENYSAHCYCHEVTIYIIYTMIYWKKKWRQF